MADLPTDGSNPKVYSVSVRMQRTITEDVYVLVPVDDRVVTREADGTGHIDWAEFTARAIEISQHASDWKEQTRAVAPHPIQGPRPEGRVAENQWPVE